MMNFPVVEIYRNSENNLGSISQCRYSVQDRGMRVVEENVKGMGGEVGKVVFAEFF